MNFRANFYSLTGNQPYAWQSELFSLLVTGEIPSSLTLPTGSGKTNAIVCWLLALCENSQLPRRLVYIVDRRSVVDQSTKVVEGIAAKLSVDSPDIAPIRDRLAQTAGGEELLAISTLRGEFQDNQEWSKFPFRPAVICGTVDMVGSRLLFSGYGDSAYSRSLHAGLLGNDSLVIFDECHLVPEFGTTLRLIQEAGGKLKSFHYMLMSATSADTAAIQISEADINSDILGKRLHAEKNLDIVSTDKPVVAHITFLAQSDPPQRTIVFVRSPQDAAKIASTLRKSHKYVITLTGTMRGKERDELVDNPIFKAFTIEHEPEAPHFLVATSAGEVGIDLTCTRMLTDMSSLASLVQRFGRCNRFGETNGRIALVYNAARLSEEYKAAVAFLSELEGDVSCLNLWNHRKEPAALTPEVIAPQSLPAHILDVLSMTSLRHDLDISVYLRGREEDSRYVDVAWRKEVALLAEMNDSDFQSYMKQMRVLSFEKLNETVRRTTEVVEEIAKRQGDTAVVVVQKNGTRLVTTLGELRHADLRDGLLFLPPDRGGLSGGMLATENADEVELDIAELAHKHHQPRMRYVVPTGTEIELEHGWDLTFETEVDGIYIAVGKKKEKRALGYALLEEHCQSVARTARTFAQMAGLDSDIIDEFDDAGNHHDDGKASPIWQFAAKGGSVERPLAKAPRLDGRKLAGYRHEFASLNSLSEKSALVKHLVGSHHGGGRPTWTGEKRLSPGTQNPDMVFQQVLRFADLQSKYGWWGLAYLEAILRAADAYVSSDD